MERAKAAAGAIFSSYPDWGKAPEQYIASIVEQLAYYPDYVLTAMAHPATGIATRGMFLPTKAEVKAFADKVIDDHHAAQRYAQAQRRRHAYLPGPRTPFRPFPALWAAFSDEPAVLEALDHPGSFEFLDDAGRTLATRGKDAARKYILPEVPA